MQQNWIQAIFLFLGFLVTWAAWVLFGVFATVRLVVVDFCQNGEVHFQLSFYFFLFTIFRLFSPCSCLCATIIFSVPVPVMQRSMRRLVRL